jgi:cystathionine gamma-lyase
VSFETDAVRAGGPPDPATGALNAPVYFTSAFRHGAPAGFDYARAGHPTRAALERSLAALEGARAGLCCASGLAAANTLMALLSAGDHVVAAREIYPGTRRLFTQIYEKFGVRFTFVDATDPDFIAAAIEPATRWVWLESPANPSLSITDLARAAELAHRRGARLVVDNTLATPVLQRPMALGADFVLHGAGKYLGGHSDLLLGAVLTNDEEAFERMKAVQNTVGAVPGPLDCFLALRGIKTLHVRIPRHCENARRVAERLRAHPDVTGVRYPGLIDFPGHAVARRQMKDFGGIVGVALRGGAERHRRFRAALRLFTPAPGFGGVESLVSLPAPAAPEQVPWVRLSVGIESADDLVADLEQAAERSR